MTVVESPKGRASHNLGNRGAIPPFPPPGYCYIFFQNLSRKESSSPPAPSRFRLILRLEKPHCLRLPLGPPSCQNRLQYHALSGTLLLLAGMRVVHGHVESGVPQRGLDDSRVLALCHQERRQRVTERMEPEPLDLVPIQIERSAIFVNLDDPSLQQRVSDSLPRSLTPLSASCRRACSLQRHSLQACCRASAAAMTSAPQPTVHASPPKTSKAESSLLPASRYVRRSVGFLSHPCPKGCPSNGDREPRTFSDP